jgi:hypothetical protein
MPFVQKLYDACKVSFSNNGPISEEALEKVRAVLGERLEEISMYLSQFAHGHGLLEFGPTHFSYLLCFNTFI